MYRFLLTPRWLGGLALAIAAAVVMVFLGVWQMHRYEERTAINNRIDAADSVQAAPLTSVLARPTVAGRAGAGGGNDISWTKVTISGRYDPAHEIQVRGRTVNGDVGFEIVTPLVLADGSAVFVDRGWIPPAGDALAAPHVPAAPAGPVTVVGQVHLSESRPTAVVPRDGRLDTRRISVPRLAREMPYPVYGAYVLLTAQTPAADKAFEPIPIDHEDAWQNAGYTVQWWLFAAMALFAFGWQARREAQQSPDGAALAGASPAGAAHPVTDSLASAAAGPAGLSPAGAARPVTDSRAAGPPGPSPDGPSPAGAARPIADSPADAAHLANSPADAAYLSDTPGGATAAGTASPCGAAGSDGFSSADAAPPTGPLGVPDGTAAVGTSSQAASPTPGSSAQPGPGTSEGAHYPGRRPGAIARARAARKARPLDRVEESDQKAAARSARRPE